MIKPTHRHQRVDQVHLGPAGAAGGAVLGVAGEELMKRASATVWGFVFARIPFISARKLLLRAVRAEYESMARLTIDLRTIWQNSAHPPVV